MNLAAVLAEVYGDRAQIADPGGVCIRIDDQREGDVYPGFCQIYVATHASEGASVLLELSAAPFNEDVRKVVECYGGRISQGPLGAAISLSIGPQSAHCVQDLAKAIGRVIRRGQRYPDPNWKWMCPRTAKSLDQLAKHLVSVHRSTARKREETPNRRQTARPVKGYVY